MNQHESTLVSAPGLSRRQILKTVPALSGLVLGVSLPGVVSAADPPKYGGEGMPNGVRDDPRLFVSVGTDGTVTVVVHRSEMGQGVRTSLPMVVADEMEADWNRVKIAQAPGDEEKYGNQDTDGSRSMRHWYAPMRTVGASARRMLELAAAQRWKVPVEQVAARQHEVIDLKTGKRLGFGALALDAAKQPVPAKESLKLKTPSEFRYIGKGGVHLVDNSDITHGRTHFGIDTRLPNLLYAVIARPPVLGAKVASFDAVEALAIPGVVKVVEVPSTPPPAAYLPLGGVAVIAKDTWTAIKARKALKIQWTDSPHGSFDSASYRAELERSVRQPGGKVVREQGDAYAALEKAARKFSADYYVPHLAHVCMEPPAATARIVDGRCEIWACVQSPQAARADAAKILGVPLDKVTVNVTLLGGGFGRKSQSDFAAEAVHLSRAMNGGPVKVTWTREDDLHHDYFHAVSAQHLEAGVDAAGKVTAWLHRTAEPTFMSLFMPDPKQLSGIELGLGLVSLPFNVPNLRIENPAVEAHVRVGWMRSVNNIQHAFAAQSFVAEIAAALGRDPKDMLLEFLGSDRVIDPRSVRDEWNHGESPDVYPINTGRLRRVIERVASEARWGRKMPAGSGLGLAAHYSFVTYTAAVVEVTVDKDGKLAVPRVDIAVDCGTAINPDRVRSLFEGACINGLSHALFGEVTFKDGRAQQDNFHQYGLVRMAGAPRELRVHIVNTPDAPLGGIGEPGVPSIAPALGNAIFAATGVRVRELPIREQMLKAI